MAMSAWLYWLPRTAIGEKNRLARKKNWMRLASGISWWNARHPPSSSSTAMKNWLFSSRIGRRIAEVRASATLYRAWSASSERKKPAFVSWRTKPCVTRMPPTDSASVAVTRLKLSCEARLSRLSSTRKRRLTVHSTGASASTIRNSVQSQNSMAIAANTICPPWMRLTKNTSWMPIRTDSTSEVTRLRIRPSFVRWKKLIGIRWTCAKKCARSALTAYSPSSRA